MKQYLWITRWNEKRKNMAIENHRLGYEFIYNYTTNDYKSVFNDLGNDIQLYIKKSVSHLIYYSG